MAPGANADANPQNWRDATPAGLRRRDLDGHDQTGAPGTGAGSGSHVRYTPGRFRADTVLRVPPHGVLLPGVQVNGGDEQTTVLLHELSHSLRHLYAAFHPELIPEARTTAVSSGGLPRAFDNSEELFAITVGNVFCSERNLSLRGGHVTQGPPGTPQSEVLRHLEFWREPTIYRLLTQAMGRMPAFTARIAAIDTRFNPFRAIRAGVGPFPRLRDWHGQPMDPYSSHGA
jgi:hypothetical protein